MEIHQAQKSPSSKRGLIEKQCDVVSIDLFQLVANQQNQGHRMQVRA
jgi:hypothetical protein